MMVVTRDFYTACVSLANQCRRIPSKIPSILYDPRFTDEETIRSLIEGEDPGLIDIPGYFKTVFADLDYTTNHFNCLEYVCDSDDISEPIERGSFVYYAGPITSGIAVLYMQSTHPWALPSRAVLYGPEYQIEFSNDTKDVWVYQVNKKLKDVILYESRNRMCDWVCEYLKRTDRQLLDPPIPPNLFPEE